MFATGHVFKASKCNSLEENGKWDVCTMSFAVPLGLRSAILWCKLCGPHKVNNGNFFNISCNLSVPKFKHCVANIEIDAGCYFIGIPSFHES